MTEGTESLRKEAYRLLQEFKLMAEQNTATDLYKIEAEMARAIVAVAEERSRFLRLFLTDPRLAVMEQCVISLETDIGNVLSADGREHYMPKIKAVIGKTLDEMRTEQNDLSEQFEQFEWNAWDKACQQLTTKRPGQVRTSQPSR
jgi:hypothetical protein